MDLRAIAFYVRSKPHDAMSSKNLIRKTQQRDRRAGEAMVAMSCSFLTCEGRASLDEEVLFRIVVDSKAVSSISSQARLTVCT